MKLKNLRSKQRRNARRKDWRVCRVPAGHCEIIGVGAGMIRFRVRPRGDCATGTAAIAQR